MYHEDMKQTLEQKIKERTEHDGECLIWRGSLGHGRFPRLKHEGRYVSAARSLYELNVGAIGDTALERTCDSSLCISSDHMIPFVPESLPEKLERLCRWEQGCLLWSGRADGDGYPLANFDGRPERVHRLMYSNYVGDIPEGMHVNHTCWNRSCLNVKHLELVTNQQNSQYRSGAQPGSTTGIRGVQWLIREGRYIGVVKHNGKYHTKRSSDIEVVKEFVKNKRKELFGRFAGGN